ncbi:MAG: hypothetical protein WCA21_14680 [Terracidiphilus sp.]
MKLPSIIQIRIPILLALSCGEIASIFILRGHLGFHRFLAASLAVMLLILPLFWIHEFWRRNISYFVVAFSALGIALLIADLLISRRITQAPMNFFLFSFWILILLRKNRQHSKGFSEEQYQILKAEDIRFFWVCINLVGLVSCFIYPAFYPDGVWANAALPVAFLFLCGVVYCLFIKRTHISSGSDSLQDKLNSGGRA